MSKKKTAKELRLQAAELLQQAEALENERAAKIGKLIINLESENYEGVTLEVLIAKISKIN